MNLRLSDKIFEDIKTMPSFDAHTHLDARHPSARGLADILLYHMVVSDLYSAGCPNGKRVPEYATEEYEDERLEKAVKYLPNILNTSCYFGVKTILSDLYGIDELVTADNYKEINKAIKKKSSLKWAEEITKRAYILRYSTEFVRRGQGECDHLFQYQLEWAFFTRCQWGQYDTALIELEYVWGCDGLQGPLPVSLVGDLSFIKKKIKTVDDADEAVRNYCAKIPFESVIAIVHHISTDITYRAVTRLEMEEALKNRAVAGVAERDIYANYIFEAYLSELCRLKKKVMLQFSIGAEPLPYETGSKLSTKTFFEIASIAAKYRDLNFMFMLSSYHQNQTLCTLARECPNISVTGYWWHNFFPSYIKKIIDERLDMLALNKNVAFFSDAYCMDWAYAKSIIVKRQYANVLAERIDNAQFDYDTALKIAACSLKDAAESLLGCKSRKI